MRCTLSFKIILWLFDISSKDLSFPLASTFGNCLYRGARCDDECVSGLDRADLWETYWTDGAGNLF
jgi:hypothetical protein